MKTRTLLKIMIIVMLGIAIYLFLSVRNLDGKLEDVKSGDLEKGSINLDRLSEDVFKEIEITKEDGTKVAGVITDVKIEDGVLVGKLILTSQDDGVVSEFEIEDGSITEEKLSEELAEKINSLEGFALGEGDVMTVHLANGSVTEVKIDDGAVTSTKILNGTITNIDISSTAAISWSKISKIGSSIADLETRSADLITISDAGGYYASSEVEGALQELGITNAGLDGTYLRLDASNDPLTGNLALSDGLYLETDEVRARDAGGLKLYDSSGIGIFIEDGGFTGIGTNDPSGRLHVLGSAAAYASVFQERWNNNEYGAYHYYVKANSTGGVPLANQWTGGPVFAMRRADGTPRAVASIWTQIKNVGDGTETGDLVFSTGTGAQEADPVVPGVEKMRLTSAGRLGIGNTNPGYLLDVNGTSNFEGDIRVGHNGVNNGASRRLTFYGLGSTGNIQSGTIELDSFGSSPGGEGLRLGAGGATPFTIFAGETLISNSNIRATSSLNLASTGSTTGIILRNISDQTSGSLISVSDAAGTYLTVRHDGNVGIGTTNPLSNLVVQGENSKIHLFAPSSNTELEIDGSGGNLVINRFGSTTARSATTTLKTSDVTYWQYGLLNTTTVPNADNNFIIHDSVGGSVALSILSNSGRVGIGIADPTEKLDINSDVFRLRTAKTPASATDTCDQGEIAWDTGFMYVCTATNTWKRSALSTW